MARTSVTSRKNPSLNLSGKSRMPSARKVVNRVETVSVSNTESVNSAAERHQMIKVAAYFLAEQRGFCGGDPQTDWLSAEAEVDEMLKKSGISLIH